MRGKVVLICTSDKGLASQLTALMISSGNNSLVVEDSTAVNTALAAGAADLVVFDTVSIVHSLKTPDALIPIVYLVDTESDKTETILRHRAFHTVPRPQPDQSEAAFDELRVTIEKILRRDFFGLDKYLYGFGCELHKAIVRSAGQREHELEGLHKYLRSLRAPRTTIHAIQTAADEMLTNAIYNAPTDSDGNARYAHTNRRQKITLQTTEHVTLRYGVMGRQFGLSVVDNFGSLTHERILACLRRCSNDGDQIEQKDGGAGLGLYMLFRSAQQMIFNVAAGQRTEAITLWDLSHEPRRGPALHYFEAPLPLEEAAKTTLHPITVLAHDLEEELESNFFRGKSTRRRKPQATTTSSIRGSDFNNDETTLT